MTEHRAAVKCITRVPKEKKEATMMNLYYTIKAVLELYSEEEHYRQWSLFHEEAVIAPAAVL